MAPATHQKSRGRPIENRLSDKLLNVAFAEVAAKGVDATTIAAIAKAAGTSKQAIYRRYRTKEQLVAAAVRDRIALIAAVAPLRSSVADDLRRYLGHLAEAFQSTRLASVFRTLLAHRQNREFAAVLENAEAEQRLALRQILIATPFEVDMDMRIDLLLGFVYFRLVFADAEITQAEIDRAILLALGLVAPRDPSPHSGQPGT
ncbi:TetR-like C-terminal domain-containing protein [Roseibium sp. MMSF_3412]|uniref:TetR-like C-terminal domain-containing protein n=1 Tax=Roseibium sp. MMSF_3412 TaxID=3046712 RepID=UPI00273D36E3|nr:TetR-like C-terminal domain-containing protein [Roseibium sp. MMSF_3412]